MRFLRMRPGHGEVMIAEGDVDSAGDRERLIEEFRRQLDQGLWAAVPLGAELGDADQERARMVSSFDEIPRSTDRVIFFPRAAGGAQTAVEGPAAGGAQTAVEGRAAGGAHTASPAPTAGLTSTALPAPTAGPAQTTGPTCAPAG